MTSKADRSDLARAMAKAMERVQIPAYTDRWMMGDRYGELVRVTRRKGEEIAHVKLDVSGVVVRVVLFDCTFI